MQNEDNFRMHLDRFWKFRIYCKRRDFRAVHIFAHFEQGFRLPIIMM